MSSVLLASLLNNSLPCIPHYERVALFLLGKGQQPLVIVLGLCVCSSVLPWHLCGVRSQANRRRQRQHQPERRPQVSRADFVLTWALIPKDWHGARILWYSHAHSNCCHGGMGQKAGLSNIYLFTVQCADSLDWENALCLDERGTCIR